jgi:hypothetical protein
VDAPYALATSDKLKRDNFLLRGKRVWKKRVGAARNVFDLSAAHLYSLEQLRSLDSMRCFSIVVFLLLLNLPASAAQHHCAAEASALAKALLQLHFNSDEVADNKPNSQTRVPFEELPNWGVDDKVKELAPIKALKGKGKFDVLELNGYIYKATYRMRFIFAQGEGCTLMGQEILEVADPY